MIFTRDFKETPSISNLVTRGRCYVTIYRIHGGHGLVVPVAVVWQANGSGSHGFRQGFQSSTHQREQGLVVVILEDDGAKGIRCYNVLIILFN